MSKSSMKAWGVHLFTMSGVAWAVLATLAVFNDRPRLALVWLGVAMIVDAVDGSLARWADVQTHAPNFDGAILDNIIDYMTWSFIPALFIYRFAPLPPRGWGLYVVFVIVLSSVFCYANVGLKTNDNYFVGFPAAWNIIAMCFFALGTGPWFNVLVVTIFAALTVSRLTFVHPFRVKYLQILSILVTLIWTASSGVLVATFPERSWVTLAVWWLSGLVFLAIGILRWWRGKSDNELIWGKKPSN